MSVKGTFGQNSGLNKIIPVVSHSAVSQQQNIELSLQSGHSIGDLIMKTQKQLHTPNYSSSITSNAALVSDINHSRNNLPQTITSDLNPVSSGGESFNRQLPTDNELNETIPEYVSSPMNLNAFHPMLHQQSAMGQVDQQAAGFTAEKIQTTQPLNIISDVISNPPRMMLTLVDPEKGIAQQIELLAPAADNPVVLPMNTNFPTLATMTVPQGDQILSPGEQQRQVQEVMMNTDRLI